MHACMHTGGSAGDGQLRHAASLYVFRSRQLTSLLCLYRLLSALVFPPNSIATNSSHTYPTSAVDFVVNLHQAHELPLSLAYSSGVSQFRSLRASHEVALQAAQTEMQAYGHEWASEFSAIDRLARAEDRNLLEVLKDSRSGGSATVTVMEGTAGQSAAPTAAKGGSLLHPPQPSEQGWTKGVAYLHAGDKKGAGRTRKD